MSGPIHGQNALDLRVSPAHVSEHALHVAQFVWDTNTLSWIRQAGATSGPSSDVTVTNFPATQAVTDGGGSLTVDGTFWQATQPVSGPLTNAEMRASPVQIRSDAVHDTGNSTTTPLGAGGVFLGAAFDMTGYASWSVNVFTNVASAAGGLRIEWSDDGTNWDYFDATTYDPAAGNMVTFGHKAHFVRFRFTNGGSAQAVFRVEATAQPLAVRQTRKFVGDQLSDQLTGQVVIAALQGHTTAGGGGWVDVKVNPSGALSADVTGTVAVSNFPATQPVSGPLTDAQLRAVAVPVSLASVPSHAVTNAGTFAVQATDSGAGKTLKTAAFSLSATGTIVAAVPTKRIKVYALKLVSSAALSVNFRDGASTNLEGAQPIVANAGFVESLNPPAFLFASSAGNSLDLVIAGAGTASGRVSYWDDDGA